MKHHRRTCSPGVRAAICCRTDGRRFASARRRPVHDPGGPIAPFGRRRTRRLRLDHLDHLDHRARRSGTRRGGRRRASRSTLEITLRAQEETVPASRRTRSRVLRTPVRSRSDQPRRRREARPATPSNAIAPGAGITPATVIIAPSLLVETMRSSPSSTLFSP
ncbi:MAG: hypothetical protein CMJ22_08805 [Phycisphaerae bacterium]|nr:hypothetical protein [Phycisphaerae bacterium]